jgi:hypothetical protein
MERDQDRKPGERPERIALVSCTRCDRLHAVEHLLDFHPVCPPCTGR